jgi:mannose/cellobiose epimerase-like protein (N-acyl-D-glucosamine 2-epimerase family)
VAQSAQTLLWYLQSAGLWRDCLTVNGRFIDEAAPASNFYHIVGAICELGGALRAGHHRAQ